MKLWIILGIVIVIALAVAFFIMGNKKDEAPAAAVQVPTAPTAAASSDPQKAFLEDNLKKPGWKATPSGLEYKVEKEAANPAAPKPAPGSEVTINYEGSLIDGTVFDSSYKRNEPITFPLSQLIPGWQEGVPMMREGQTWTFAIPSDLGYGPRGAPPTIPGGATLLFKIELLKVKTPAQ